MKDRFAKLAALTRGAAIVTISVSAGGCTKNEPPPPPVAAGTIQPDPAANPSDGGADGGFQRRKFPMPNAMHPGHGWNSPPSDAGGSADGGPNNAP